MDEAGAVHDRLEALERERSEEIARANAAVAAAQDRSYWLERWNVDLNALMRKRGAAELRAAVRAVKAVLRLLRAAGSSLPGRLAKAQRLMAQERGQAEAPPSPAGPERRAALIAQALEGAGMKPRDGDVWLALGAGLADVGGALALACPELARYSAADAQAALERMAELRSGLQPGARLVLGTDDATATPGWLLAQATPEWRMVLYREGDPVLYVLERR